ncbi:GCN5-related N-acetyltransferase [Thozetella sp. PMI_491]|nr:GCN5-related N-acetyltransferase [Thozetella sp. PMI_491]
MADPTTTSTGSIVELREINESNWRDVINLRVAACQTANVSSNVHSLCESHYSKDAWVRAIYANETPVGFLMMSIWDPEEWYSIWRFMIDQNYQGKGYGRAAIELAIAYIREQHPQAKTIRLMTTGLHGKKGVEACDSPYKFYVSMGWKDISSVNDDGELEMGLQL